MYTEILVCTEICKEVVLACVEVEGRSYLMHLHGQICDG